MKLDSNFAHWPRYWWRARHVLSTEGLPILLGKIARRLRTTPVRIHASPALPPLRLPYQPLVFRRSSPAAVSIIVPLYNGYLHSYRCLSALQAHATQVPFEVIVVDDCSTDETATELARASGLIVLRNPSNLGFVGTCNRGAAAAHGQILIFLNNDTVIQPGWLDALVSSFSDLPEAGIVGSRLLYPSGRQQEAGGVIFQDGSAWNYGHLDDPGRPEYSYLREVDYVSGAALAIRRALFERLGGFDQAFAPAYYEDADLAFRARSSGARVYYQPQAQVVHLEGASCGHDAAEPQGLKRYQRAHQAIFADRWQQQLQRHGQRGKALEQQKERQIRRRALVVDTYMLTPDRESGSLRMFNLLTLLQEQGFKVSFAALNLEAPEPYVSALQRRGVEVFYRPYVNSLRAHLREQGELYQLVILSRVETGSQLMSVARRHCQRAQIVYDTVDLHFLRESRLAALTGTRAAQHSAERRQREEFALIRSADQTLVVSPYERDLLSQKLPDADVHLLSNIHICRGRQTGFAARQGLLFIGAFAHPPNTDAIRWFCTEVLPLLWSVEPGLGVSIIGADPSSQVRALASANVQVLGHVPDLDPYLDGCRLSVAPLRYGAGVKGKISISLASGLPVVATPQAAEGMSLVHRESALIGATAAEFAAAVLEGYQDPDLWQRLSEAGLAVMERQFGFAAARTALAALLNPELNPESESARA